MKKKFTIKKENQLMKRHFETKKLAIHNLTFTVSIEINEIDNSDIVFKLYSPFTRELKKVCDLEHFKKIVAGELERFASDVKEIYKLPF